MPCSASTAACAAASAPPVSTATSISARRTRTILERQPLTPPLSPRAGRGRDPRSGRVRGSALADRLIEPLVIKGAFERRQLLAKFLGMGRRCAGIEGFAIAPRLDQGEMIGVPIPLQHVVAQIAVVLAGGFGLRLDQCRGLVLEGRKDI